MVLFSSDQIRTGEEEFPGILDDLTAETLETQQTTDPNLRGRVRKWRDEGFSGADICEMVDDYLPQQNQGLY